MRKTPVVALIIVILLIGGCAPQSTSGAPVMEANRLYEDGQFAQAATAYQALLDDGVQDGRVYYNLGNAHFKMGDLGRAVLNYRRAQGRLPRDPDVEANLDLARAQTRDRLDGDGSGPLVELFRHVLTTGTTMDELAAIMLSLWVLLCCLLMGIIFWPRRRPHLKYAILVVAALLALSLVSVGVRALDERGRAPAVVVAPSVEAHSGPGYEYLSEFSLHAGAEIRVLEERGGWARIALPGELQGWVPEESVEKV
jgi:tetratricopeptide (TPR) repeat protein